MEKYVTIGMASEMTGLKRSTIYTYIWSDKIKAIKAEGQRTVIPLKEVLRYSHGGIVIAKKTAPELDLQVAACTDKATDTDIIAEHNKAVKSTMPMIDSDGQQLLFPDEYDMEM